MDNVLIVDDDLPFLTTLKESLDKYEGQFKVLTASDGEKAMETMGRLTVSVVVIDLEMPNMDGLELLAQIRRTHVRTPCILMLERQGGEERRAGWCQDILFIDKPLDFNELASLVITELDRLDEGVLPPVVSVSTFLQLIESARKTCLLQVHCAGKGKGFFCFQKGVLYYAICDSLVGEDAAREMIGWDSVDFRIVRSLKEVGED